MEVKIELLRIEAAPADWKGPNEVYCGLGGYPWYKTIEQAGRGYAAFIKRRSGAEEEVVEKKEAKDNNFLHTLSKEEEEKLRQHKKAIEAEADDPYIIMGLDHLRWKATDDDIKTAYRKLVLLYHPDKLAAEDKSEEADALFKKISKSNETLSDLKKRRTVDSNDDFDDSIPSGLKEKQDFYAVFTPYFVKFARWSLVTPVPELGDENTPMDKVKKFYDFWSSFKSWRDYSFEDEHKLDDAESRDEKRWMERENDKKRRKHKKEEASRIFKLSETAEKFDPRVRKQRDELLNAKQKVKDAKLDEKKKKQDEIDQKIREEKEAKEAEEKKKLDDEQRKKIEKGQEKKKMRVLRGKLRGFFGEESKLQFKPSPEDVETLCERLNLVKMTELTNLFETDEEKASEMFKKEVDVLHNTHFDMVITKTPSPKPQNKGNVKDSNKPWTEQELSMLAKAMSKYPGGVQQRWELISQFIGTRSVKDVIAKSKDGKSTPSKPTQLYQADDAYERFNKNKKAGPEVQADGGISVRTVEESTATSGATKEADWSVEEQKALEKALNAHPAADKERWEKIAKDVGKSKKDCIARFKYLVSKIKEKSAPNKT